MDKEGASRVWGPCESRNKSYNGKYCVEGFWFSPEKLLKRFELVGRKYLPKESTDFRVRARKKGEGL